LVRRAVGVQLRVHVGAAGAVPRAPGAALMAPLAGSLRAGIEEVGELASFSARTTRELRGTVHYAGEVLRQACNLIIGSALILVAMELVIGGECGLFTAYFGRSFGASGAVGLFTMVCDVREMFPYMFGYILAAKVGCGLVAEIGSMRIAEEIDA